MSDDAQYVLLPNEVLWYPPIQSAGAPRDARRLWPAEFYVLGGLLIAARSALAQHRHVSAFAGGRTAIRREVRTSRTFFEQRETAELEEWALPTKGRAIRSAGALGYRGAKRALRVKAPETVDVTITRRQLLRAAGLAPGAEHFRAIDGMLDRLTRPVGDMPPPLRELGTAAGRLRLRVEGAWLPARRFKRVVWPPPKRSPAALALHLIVTVLDARKLSTREVTAAWMAERLGLDPASPGRNRAINAAFAKLNAYLAALSDDVIRRLWHARPRLDVPGGYVVDPITPGLIRVVPVERREVYDPEEDDYRPAGQRRSLKRSRRARRPEYADAEAAAVFASGERESAAVFAWEREKVQRSLQPAAAVFASPEPREAEGPREKFGGTQHPYENDGLREKLIVGEKNLRKSAPRAFGFAGEDEGGGSD